MVLDLARALPRRPALKDALTRIYGTLYLARRPTIWCFFAALQSAAAMVFEVGWPTAFEPRPRKQQPDAGGAAANGAKANGKAQ